MDVTETTPNNWQKDKKKKKKRKPHPLQGKHRRRERELDTRAPMKKATDAAFWDSTSMLLVLLDMPSLQEKKRNSKLELRRERERERERESESGQQNCDCEDVWKYTSNLVTELIFPSKAFCLGGFLIH
jgi:hypothetical protein